jgi:hypothetical protein
MTTTSFLAAVLSLVAGCLLQTGLAAGDKKQPVQVKDIVFTDELVNAVHKAAETCLFRIVCTYFSPAAGDFRVSIRQID